jgi:hypothetical protein
VSKPTATMRSCMSEAHSLIEVKNAGKRLKCLKFRA